MINLKAEAIRSNTFILAKILLPYGITDIYPECYKEVKKVSPFSRVNHTKTIRIAVHIRRGELFVVDSHRMLPNQYYLSVIQNITNVLEKLGYEYTFEIYTELPKKAFTVTPVHHGIDKRITEPVIVSPELWKIEEFDIVPNLKKFINTDPIETIERMSTATILVMSHSSFSYLASLLNPQGVVVYHRFWHSPLSNWIITDDQGNLSQEKFQLTLEGSTYHIK